MKIVAVSGSIRKDSYNTKVLEFMKERYKDKMDIEILDISDLPMYNQDIENEEFDSVKRLRSQIKDADGIIFATPEHNHTMPVAMKNFLDWMSRIEYPLIGKPGMIVGASLGRLGTVKAQGHLREVLDSMFVGVKVLPANNVYLGDISNQMDEKGNITNKGTIEFLDSVVDNFIDWVEMINK